MPYNVLETFLGKVVGDGQCVALVKAACGTPATALWNRGALVKATSPSIGTAIATFDPPTGEFPKGRYGNHEDGRSHAAIYMGQDLVGIHVIDQWKGKPGQPPQPAHRRVIRFKAGKDTTQANDGDAFFIVE